jgi:cytochrome c biogenesis protein CcdA
MVETIAPVVYEGKKSRYLTAVALFATGAVIAAALVGLLAGALGTVAGAPWDTTGWIVVAVLALLYALREVFRLPIPVPDRHQQVPLWWRSFYSQRVTAVLYGFGLGLGYLTYLSYGTYFVVTIAALVSGNPLIGMALCAPFGLGRALSVLLANRRLAEEISSGIDRIDEVAGTATPRIVTTIVLLGVGAAALLTL